MMRKTHLWPLVGAVVTVMILLVSMTSVGVPLVASSGAPSGLRVSTDTTPPAPTDFATSGLRVSTDTTPPAPTDFATSGIASTAAAFTWVNPLGTYTQNVIFVFYGAGCTGAQTSYYGYTITPAADSGTAAGLTNNTAYSAYVELENVTVVSGNSVAIQPADDTYGLPSNCANFSTPASGGSFEVVDYITHNYHLSNFNPLFNYEESRVGAEMPVLASDTGQPAGIYYVGNDTGGSAASCPGKLPFYELGLITNTTRLVGCVYPLFTFGYFGAPSSGMLQNEFTIEYGYDQALFLGTTQHDDCAYIGLGLPCHYSLELLDLTTGVLLDWNTPGNASVTNMQADLVGNNTVVVLSDNGTAWAWNLLTHRSWEAYGSLGESRWSAPIEANNIYWLPQRQEFINIEAHGDPYLHGGGFVGNEIQQLDATWVGGEFNLTKAVTIHDDTNETINWVNGLAYNASYGGYGAIAYTAGYCASNPLQAHNNAGFTYVISYNSFGLLNTTNEVRHPNACYNNDDLQIDRYIYTGDYMWTGYDSSLGVNTLFDPWNGSVVLTNLVYCLYYDVCGNPAEYDTYAPASTYYLIDAYLSQGVGCLGACNSGNDAPVEYSVTYACRVGHPCFPGAIATSPPAPTNLHVSNLGYNRAELEWTQSTGGGIINETVHVFKGTGTCSGAPTAVYSTSGPAVSFSYSPIDPFNYTYSAYVTSWNSTGQSPASNCVSMHIVISPVFGVGNNSLLWLLLALLAFTSGYVLYRYERGNRPRPLHG